MEGPELPLENEPTEIEQKEPEYEDLKLLKGIEKVYDSINDEIDIDIAELLKDIAEVVKQWEIERQDVRFRLDKTNLMAEKMFDLYKRIVNLYAKEIKSYKRLVGAFKLGVHNHYLPRTDYASKVAEITQDMEYLKRAAKSGKIERINIDELTAKLDKNITSSSLTE